SLKPLIRAATRVVPDPEGAGTVYEEWLRGHQGDTAALTLGNLGGGSDFAPFYHHLGIPAGGIGFDGPEGIYHSAYDSYDWMSRFGDPGYKAHQAGARLVGVILARLANADILQLDYGIAEKKWSGRAQGLREALGRFTGAARAFSAARDSALAAGADSARCARANAALMQVERRLTRAEGLATRPWYKSL